MTALELRNRACVLLVIEVAQGRNITERAQTLAAQWSFGSGEAFASVARAIIADLEPKR